MDFVPWRYYSVAWRQVRVGLASAFVFLTGIAFSDEYANAFVELRMVKAFAHLVLYARHSDMREEQT